METLSQESDFLSPSDMETILTDIHREPAQFNDSNALHQQNILSHLQDGSITLGLQDELTLYGQDLSVPVPSPTDTIPSREFWQGPLNFEIFLDSATCGKKSWVYSRVLNKVFLDMSKSLLIGFKVSPFRPDLRVRALPVYSMADYIKEPVERCQFHYLYDDPFLVAHPQDQPRVCQCENYNMARHLVTSSHSHAFYDYNGVSNRHSVVVPLDAPPAGGDITTVEYRFTCKTSCLRGMNRRPIEVVFTLETADCRVVGRLPIGVKICSCPKRDKEKEETDAMANNNGDQCPGSGKRKMLRNSHGQLKKIKSENPAPPQGANNETNAGELNEIELSAQVSSLNCQVKRLEAIAAEQTEQLKRYESTTFEQLRQLEAKVEAVSAQLKASSDGQIENLKRLEEKIDALLNIQ